MSRVQKRDGSSVYQRLKADAKARRTERHQQFMDRKLGRNREDSVVSAEQPDPSLKLWSDVANQLGMQAESDGQGGVRFADGDQQMELKRDSDGILRWQFPEAEAPAQPESNGEMQLVEDKDGILRWVFPGEKVPEGASTPSNGPNADLWKQVGEQLGMSVEENGRGGLVFRDR